MSALSTKGPWSATSDGFIAAPSDQMNDGYYIAQVYGPDAAENIKIIAAAPELAGELKRMFDHFSAWANDHADEATCETWGALHCAREALSTAGA